MSEPDFNFDDLMDLFGDGKRSGNAPLDVMHQETEKEIERIKKRLAAEYKQAEKEMKRKAKKYLAEFKEADKKKRQLVKDGKLSQEKYIEWRQNKILGDELFKRRIDNLSEHLVNADKQARDIVHKRAFGVYANNFNWGKYEVEKGFGINTGFVLFDERSVERLASKNPQLLPDPSKKTKEKIREKKIQKWSKRKINNSITQGILQGEAIDDIAKRLEDAVRMGWNNAVRNARTAITGAQNAGRLDSYRDSQKLGINMQKQWMATLDERTRTSHQELDGESVPLRRRFSNKLMFPGDPEGAPAEVYNCRCTLVADLIDYPDEGFERYVNGESVGDMTYTQWAKSKGVEPKTKEQTWADKIKEIKNDPNLTTEEKIEKAGQVFADEMEKEYVAELRNVNEERRKIRSDLYELGNKGRGHTQEYKDLKQKKSELDQRRKQLIGKGHDEQLAKKLSKIRNVGFNDEAALRTHLSIRRLTDTGRSAITAYQHYPTDWVNKSIAKGYLSVKKVQRGYYSDWAGELALSGSGDNCLSCAYHELGHRFEKAVNEILKQESEFYKRRTANEPLQWLGSGYSKSEKTRKDNFINSYMGKDYGGFAYELVSMGFEYAYTRPVTLSKDKEMQRWIYGMLCIL